MPSEVVTSLTLHESRNLEKFSQPRNEINIFHNSNNQIFFFIYCKIVLKIVNTTDKHQVRKTFIPANGKTNIKLRKFIQCFDDSKSNINKKCKSVLIFVDILWKVLNRLSGGVNYVMVVLKEYFITIIHD